MPNKTIAKGLAGLLGVGAALGLVGRVDAGIIKVYNKGQSGVTGSILTVDNLNDPSSNSPFNSSNIKLGIYSIVNINQKLMLQSLSTDPQSLDFYLDVITGPTTSTNMLRFEVPDNSGFTEIQAFNTASPSVKYNIPLNNGPESFYDISLDSLDNQPAGEYAHWRMEITPEPATLALLGLGAATLIAGGRRKRKRAE